jgi:membrane fusion protein
MRTAEPTYRITVEIAEQAVAAYGRTFTLQPGMLLQADIILESRSILAWLFDPLVSLRGRT